MQSTVIADGFVPASQLWPGLRRDCKTYGIS